MHVKCEVEHLINITALYSAFEEKFSPEYTYGGETHDFWEMVCVLDGQVGITAGTEIFSLKKGEMIIHPPMEFHSIRSENKTSPRVFFITFFCDEIPNLQKTGDRIYDVAGQNMELLTDIIKTLDAVYNRRWILVTGIKEDMRIAAACFLLRLELFILSIVDHGAKPENSDISLGKTYYLKAINYINDNIDKQFSTKIIADYCHVSESYLKKIFSKYAGIGVMKYTVTMKINEAKRLIKQGASIKEASLKVGFEDRNYFSTVFTRIIGYAPSTFYNKDQFL